MIINVKDQKTRARYWYLLLYPDSAAKNWLEVLKGLMVKCAVSPLHDQDINDKGELLKPHYHILLAFNSGTRVAQVNDIIYSINAFQNCEIVHDKQLAFEYLWHNNNPDKVSYDRNDITYINSNYYDYLSNEYKDILNYIDDNDIKSLKRLTQRLRYDNLDTMLKYVSQNTYYIKLYIDDSKSEYETRLKNARDEILRIANIYDLKNIINAKDIQNILSKLKELGIDNLEIMGE